VPPPLERRPLESEVGRVVRNPLELEVSQPA
jgi:hypothetical protein